MSVRLMTLRNVPEDELEEIHALLDQHEISHYETPPSNWFISAGAIWLDDPQQLQQAYTLLNGYQQQRTQQSRQEYERRCEEGRQPGLVDRLLENPLQFIIYLAFALFILYISVMPFIDYGK